MTELGDAPVEQYTKDQLLRLLSEDLTKLAEECVGDEYSSERRIAINRAKRNWRYVKGDHFFAPGWVTDDGGEDYVDFVSVDGSPEDNGAAQRFCYAANVIGSDCWKYVAVVGQNAPNVKCVPDDVDDQQSIDDAKKADISAIDFRAKWQANAKQRELAFHQYTTGPIFGRVRYVTSARKYGVTTVPKMTLQEQVLPDGSVTMIPVPDGEQTYENGDVELDLFNVLHVSIPFGKKKIEDCEWLRLQHLENKYKLLSRYRKQLEEDRKEDEHGGDKDSTTNTSIEAQDATANPSGSGKHSKKNNWLYTEFNFQPDLYEGFELEWKRELAKSNFPDGLMAVRVNEKWVDLENQNLADAWMACKTGRGEYIMENPLCHDSIPFQKAINDIIGLAVEIVLRGIPKTIVDQGLIDRKAASESEANPLEIIFTMGNNGGDLSKAIATLPMAKMSDQQMPFLDFLRKTMQDVSQIRPELAGGGEAVTTYREAKQRKDQAMMTLGPPADEHQRFWEKAFENGTRLRAKFGSGQIKVQQPGSFGITTDTLEMSELTEGSWHCEADEGVPASFTERADRLLGLLKEYPPEVVLAMGLTDLMNISQLLHLFQLTGFKSPMEDEYNKVIKTIGLLAQEEPIQDPGPVDMYTGMPIGPPITLPSRQIDDVEDDPTFVFQVARKWMNSPEGQKLKEQNQIGYENVKAYARQAQQMIQAAAMAAMPPPDGEAPGKESPPAEEQAEPLSPIPIEGGPSSPQPTIQ